MANIDYLISVIQEQEEIVLALEDRRIDEVAKKIAFYSAMIDAASDDPIDDSEDQDALLKYLRAENQQLIEAYQNLVNGHL